MITIEPTTKKKEWDVYRDNEVIFSLELESSSLVNKFEIIQNVLVEFDNLCIQKDIIDENGSIIDRVDLYFTYWFNDLFDTYLNKDRDANYLYSEALTAIEFSKKYIENKQIDFKKFVDRKKATKTSIIFDEKNLKDIAISSTCLKMYAIFLCDKYLKPPKNMNDKIFRLFTKNCYESKTIDKIFKLMKARTFKSYLVDKYLWDLCKIKISETPDSYIMAIFNYLMTNLFVTLDPKINPIPYLNSIVDGSISWLMRAAHNDVIIYGQVFGKQEDIYGSSSTQHSLSVYCCNDVIGKSAKLGLRLLEKDYNLTQFEYESSEERIEKVEDIYPYMKLLNLPIISSVLEIPYKHLLTIPPKHVILMSVLMNKLSDNIIDSKFPFLLNFLVSCPKNRLTGVGLSGVTMNDADREDEEVEIKLKGEKQKNFILTTTRSSYKFRYLEYVLNDKNALFGFSCPKLKYRLLSGICGVLSASKKSLFHIITGKGLPRIKNVELEEEVSKFYNNHYSGKLNTYYEEMRNRLDEKYF